MLSIDVGIKHMAYCFFQKDINKIQQWGIIDLTKDTTNSTIELCHFCLKNAYISYKNSLYCKRHMKLNINKPIFVISETNFQSLKISKLEEIETFMMNECHDMKELCLQKQMKNKTKIEKIHIISLFYKEVCCIEVNKISKASNQISLITLGKNLKNHFDSLQFDGLQTVIIENQLSPIASRMKTIQGMVAQYFLMKDCYTNLTTIEFVSSQNKLKDVLKDTKIKLSYKERKAKSIEVCLQLLETEDPQFIEIFKNSSKKDDLADCFLQGYSYLQKKAF